MIKINIENEYKGLLSEILNTGSDKEDRTGTGTKSLFGRTIKHDMSLGFPILTGKRVSFNAARTELLWILQGRTDLKYLEDNGVKYWRPDYERSGRTDETLGPVYGKQWRDFNGVDQLANLVNAIRINPWSRRMLVSAWNPADMDDMVLPPCHYGFQIYTTELTLKERQEEFCHRLGKDISFAKNLEHLDLDKDNVPKRKISLMWNQRSVDVFLGLPFNIASYALLLELIGREANMIPDQLIGNLGDTHLYLNHIEQAKEQLKRDPIMLPEIELSNVDILSGEFNYDLGGYESHPSIKAQLSN